jgi:hypothetical protein
MHNKFLELDDVQLAQLAAQEAKLSVRRRKDNDIYSLLGLFAIS